ncbi:Solute carrier family 35 member F2-like protein [Drosera capensis]
MANEERISWWRKHEGLLRKLFVLFLGQAVSLTMALMAFSSSYLADLGVDAPLTQSFFSYVSLAAVYGSIMLFRRKKLLVPWYYYIGLGFVDVQGNYLVNTAFQYSSITSVTLLDCFTIPWVIVLTWIFIGTRYSIWQYVGSAACILGLGLVFLSDAGIDDGSAGTKPLLGDVLVVAGTLFYAFSNVGEEYCVKKKDLVEVVTMLSTFGTLVSIIEMTRALKQSLFTILQIIGFVGYAVSSFLFYTLAPFMLKLSGATLFNLSTLTSDMWAVVIRIFFYHQTVDWLYYLSFAIVVVGLIIYSQTEKDPAPTTSIEDENHTNGDYQALPEEIPAPRDENVAA